MIEKLKTHIFLLTIVLLTNANTLYAACEPYTIDEEYLGCNYMDDDNKFYKFGKSCEKHDYCYATIGMSKSQCDKNLYSDMKTWCDRAYDDWYEYGSKAACRGLAKTVYEAVVAGGGGAFDGAQKNAFDHAKYLGSLSSCNVRAKDSRTYKKDLIDFLTVQHEHSYGENPSRKQEYKYLEKLTWSHRNHSNTDIDNRVNSWLKVVNDEIYLDTGIRPQGSIQLTVNDNFTVTAKCVPLKGENCMVFWAFDSKDAFSDSSDFKTVTYEYGEPGDKQIYATFSGFSSYFLTETAKIPETYSYWSRFISEESKTYSGTKRNIELAEGYAATGFHCTGGRCDNIAMKGTILTDKYGSRVKPSSEYWTSWFSEESSKSKGKCSSGYYITGLSCSGGNCDNIKLKCSKFDKNIPDTSCYMSNRFSEETKQNYNLKGQFLLDAGYYGTGMECYGGRCDNKEVVQCHDIPN